MSDGELSPTFWRPPIVRDPACGKSGAADVLDARATMQLEERLTSAWLRGLIVDARGGMTAS